MFRTESYEKALEFIVENYKKNLLTTDDEQLNNKMDETALTATPTSRKRRHSDDKNIPNVDYIPKKKRVSAIRSENNLKMLIYSGQVVNSKQKSSPKKFLSLRKEVRTETLETLISAGKFDKIDKLYIKTVAASSHETKDNVESSDSEPETLPTPDKNRLENVPNLKNISNEPNPINTTSLTDLTITTNVLDATSTTNMPNPTNISNEPNPINTTSVPDLTNTTNMLNPILTTNVSNSTNISNVPSPIKNTSVPDLSNTTNLLDPISTTNVPNRKRSLIVPNPTKRSKKDTPLLIDNSKTPKTPIPESVDTNIAEISSTNNEDRNEEIETDSDVSRSSLDAEVLALHKLISDLTADSSEKVTENHSTVDIKHIEDIYKTILEIKSRLNTIYQAKSIKLRKSFETIQLFVPELKRGLTLPTLQEFKAKNQSNEEVPKSLPSQQEQLSQGSPSPQPTKPSPPTAKSPSRTTEHSTSLPECSYVAKWTLKHKEPGPGLTEILPNTGIYIDEAEFTRSKLLASDMRHLARLLLTLIFSKEALTKCSYKGWKGPNGKRPKSQDVRPGLDEHARNVLLAFVIKHGKECGWNIVNSEVIAQSLRNKIRLQFRHIS